MMGWFGNTGYGMGFGFGGIFMIVFWGAILFLVYAAAKHLTTNSVGKPRDKTPEEILKERYAKGEISQDEFNTMKQDLRN